MSGMRAQRKFHFAYEPVLKKAKWNFSSLQSDEASAKRVVLDKEADLRRREESTAAATDQIRKTLLQGLIDPVMYALTQTFLSDQIAQCAIECQDLKRATQAHRQIRQRLDEARVQIKALEKVRERHRGTHTMSETRLDLRDMDEMCMARRHAEGSAS